MENVAEMRRVSFEISRVPFEIGLLSLCHNALYRSYDYLCLRTYQTKISWTSLELRWTTNNWSIGAAHCSRAMRSTVRLLANVKPGRFLEAGTPTGLTGLFTHDAPRSTLVYVYTSTLDKLKALPETSVYRQSAESLTKHRLKIVESVKPPGYDEWAEKAKATIAAHPDVFNTPEGGVDHEGGTFGKHVKSVKQGRTFVATQNQQEPDEREEEWDGETVGAAVLEGPRSAAERADLKDIGRVRPGSDQKTITWEPEPPLEASQ